ncbi:MAG: hypothetical protein HS117_27235 [Verrucomicrobiaceae bacterium]|nr:hypothetical protein [Verrucomicrobiaceae bacterium]
MEHLERTIADFQNRLKKAEAEVIRYKKTINDLCEMAEKPPLYAETEFEETSNTSLVQFTPDAFYGKPLASSIKMILEQRKARNIGPISIKDLLDELQRGGYQFQGKEENRRIIVSDALRKNTDFHRLPNGLYGMTAWYERIKKPNASNSNDDSGNDLAETEL